MSRIALLLFSVTLAAALSADEAPNAWHPMWNAAQWQVGEHSVPIQISVESDGDASKGGVTVEMLERTVELGLRKNNIPAELTSRALSTYPRMYVLMNTIEIPMGQYGSYLAYKIEMSFQCFDEFTPTTRAHWRAWGGTLLYSWRDYWTRGVLGYARFDTFPHLVRDALSEMLDLFSLEYLKARDEAKASHERQIQKAALNE